jgi:hypothetical protein
MMQRGTEMDNSEINKVIFQLNELDSYDAKYEYLLGQNEELLNHLADLYISDQYEYENIKGRISDTFRGIKRKGTIDDLIDKYVLGKSQEKIRTKFEEFTDVPLNELTLNKTGIFPTQDNLYLILLAAKRIKCIWDEMSANIYYTVIDWDSNEPIFELPGIAQKYHKHNEYHGTELKRKLNRNGFPSEHNWGALKEAQQNVAKRNKIDFYKLWMTNIENENPDDGIERFSVENCFAVKYMGAPKEQWSAVWSRTLMLSLVWRCFSPGLPQRYYFTIEGEQNIGKTQLCRLLVPNFWYSSAALSARDDIVEFYRQTYDKAVVEFAELGGTDRASKNLFKRVVTETHSTFRRMRSDDVIDYAKRNIIILTTNEKQFLGRDESGDTRAITLRSELGQNEFMDLEGFAKEYPKILAQAIRMYRQGISCYLLAAEFELQRDQVNERDVVFVSDEYELVCDFFKDANQLEICKESGVYLDLIYTHAQTSWDMMKPELMRKSRAFGAALVKYGFSRHDNKARLVDGKIRKVWFWKDK